MKELFKKSDKKIEELAFKMFIETTSKLNRVNSSKTKKIPIIAEKGKKC